MRLPCTSWACRSRISTSATSISPMAGGRSRRPCTSTGPRWRRSLASPRAAPRWRLAPFPPSIRRPSPSCSRGTPERPRLRASSSLASAVQGGFQARTFGGVLGCAHERAAGWSGGSLVGRGGGGAHRRVGGGGAERGAPAHALETDRALAAARLGARRCRGRALPRNTARADLPRRRQPGRQPAGQRDAGRRRGHLRGRSRRIDGSNRRGRRALRAGARIALSARQGGETSRAGGGNEKRGPVRPRAGAGSGRRRGGSVAQLARPPPSLRGDGFDLLRVHPSLARARDGAERMSAADRVRLGWRLARGLGAGGGAVRLEEDVARGAADPRTVSAFKAALGPPFAALGDGFFWLALRPAAALIAAVTEPYLGLYCVLVFLAIYDGVHLAARGWLFFAGYQRGEGIVSAVSHAHVPQSTGYLKWTAALLAGAIAARTVLTAGLPHRPWHAVFIAALIVAMTAALPRLRLTLALYLALALG